MPVRPHPVLAVFTLAASVTTACLAWGIVRGSGHPASEKREVGSFVELSVASGIRAELRAGPFAPLELSGDDNVLPLVVTTVEGGRLRIGFERGTSISPREPIEVRISAPALEAVQASGGSIVKGTLASVRELELGASGGAELHLRGIDAADVSASGSGGSTLDLEGKAGTIELRLSGGTRLEADRLDTGSARIEASGGSEGTLRARETVRGSLSGGTSLRVLGGARTRVSRSGGSSVEVG